MTTDQLTASPTISPPRRASRWRVVLGVLLLVVFIGLGGLGAVLYTLSQPTLYASKVVVQVYDPKTVSNSTAGRVDPARLVPLEVTYARSPQVVQAARTALGTGLGIDHVVWSGAPDQDSITVSCYARQAANSVACATGYATAYIKLRQSEANAPLTTAAQALQNQATALRTQAAAVQTRIGATNPVTGASQIRSLIAQQNSLLNQAGALTDQYLQAKSQAAAVVASFTIVQPAVLPKQRASPTATSNLALGLSAGVVLGLAVLLIWRQLRAWVSRQRLAVLSET